MLIVICVILCQFTLSKLDALELLQQVGERSSDECTLDRLVPFMVCTMDQAFMFCSCRALLLFNYCLGTNGS